MSTNISGKKRMEKDVIKLLMSEYDVKLKDESKFNEFIVKFLGPKDSPYENGIWNVNVLLPEQYPFKSPSIGFLNKIFHPNIDEVSGSVCLDVINQTWSPMYELKNIFDVFLPQLLMYPNPSDPLNKIAAKLLLTDSNKYDIMVKEHVEKNAKILKVEELIIKEGGKNNNNEENNKFENISKFDLEANQNLCKIDKKQDEEKNNDEDKLSVISDASLTNIDIDDFC